MDFTSPPLRLTSAAVHLLGASILAYCIAARSQSSHVSRIKWRQIPWARWCTMLVFLDSWLFHAYAGLLIQGYSLSRNQVTCDMAIYLCIVIYCLSKILIYCFLIERVYVVWPHAGTRLSSKAYCVCLIMMFGYFVIAALMMIGRIAFFQTNHQCIIGLKPFASIPLLSYDLFLNVTLTSMFLLPLRQAHFRDMRLRDIARRTLLAALAALTTSSINIAVLTLKHGEEMGWICLTSCGLDVTVNALVLYWVTGYRPDDRCDNNYLTSINFGLPFSTHGAILPSTLSASANPDVVMPAPVRDKAKTLRRASQTTRFGLMPSHEQPASHHLRGPTDPVQRAVFSVQSQTAGYPVTLSEFVENQDSERRIERTQRAGMKFQRLWRSWWLWHSLQTQHSEAALRWGTEMVSQVRMFLLVAVALGPANVGSNGTQLRLVSQESGVVGRHAGAGDN